MQLLTFTDAEIRQISEESRTFADKIARLAARTQRPEAGASRIEMLLQSQEPSIDEEARNFFATIPPEKGMLTCVNLVREWARRQGIARYSSLAGAKRLVEEMKAAQKHKNQE